MIAIDRAPLGASAHRKGGETFSPSQVYSIGMSAPSPNAGDENSNVEMSELSGSNEMVSLAVSLHATARQASRIVASTNMSCERIWGCRETEFKIKWE